MIRIALDLELESPNTRANTLDSCLPDWKIIQIGYIVFDDIGFKIFKKECFTIYVPEITKLSSFIEKLTSITTEDIKNGVPLEYAYQSLIRDQKDHSASRKLLTWGGGDQEQMLKEKPEEVKWPFGKTSFNVKHLYQYYRELHQLPSSAGLGKAMKNLGVSFEGKAHNALTDAYNTAKIFIELNERLKNGR